MKSRITIGVAALCSGFLFVHSVFAQGTAFTYQGRLNDGVNPANGSYDLTFALFNAATAGAQQGVILTNTAIAVSNGLFTVTLDFGASPFPGADRWLEIGVRTNGSAGAYQTLTPRQPLTSTPYAVRAANFNGVVSDGQLSANVARLNANQSFSGSANYFSGAINIGSNLTTSGSIRASNEVFWGSGAYLRNDQGGSIELGNSTAGGSSPYIDFHYGTGSAQDFNVRLINDSDQHLTLAGNVDVSGVIRGNGSGLLNLNASNLTSGTIADGRLAGTYSGAVTFNNASNNFTGNGAGVTNIAIGTLNGSGLLTWPGIPVLASSPSVGSRPSSVVAADVNGDGKADLISANYADNTLSVLTNNRSGGFVLASSPAVGSGPRSVVTADVNGDNKLDLISANYDGNTLSVLTNNGTTGFVLAATLIVTDAPVSVAAADVNGDGKMDLICAHELASGQLSVLTNNGSGGFALASTLSVEHWLESVVAADVNADGKMDLICASSIYGYISVLTNNGSGGFVIASSFGAGAPKSVVAADVNGDGKVDLVSAQTFGALSVHTNNGSGGFTLAASPSVSGTPVSVAVADINGDGKADLISANYDGNTLSVLTNNGSGGYVLAATVSAGNSPDSVVAADVNGDGKPDLICANDTVSGTLSVLFNAPSFLGSFSGNGAGLTSLNAANITGTLSTAQIPNLDASKITSGTLGTGQIPNLDASKITSGTVADARLSTNVALLSSNQIFTGQNTFSNSVSGGGVTLDASSTAGAFNLKNVNGLRSSLGLATVAGNYSSDAAAGDTVLRVTAGKLLIQSGSAAAAMTIAANNYVGIGTNVPATPLHVVGAGDTEISVQSTDGPGRRWTVQSSGGATPSLAGTFQIIDRTAAASRLLIDPNGNVGIGNSGPTNKLHVAGGVSATAFVTTSDRNAKENFAPVSPREVLDKVVALPITTWNFKTMNDGRHIGPMAQDFHAAFGLGGSDTTITSVDPDGVALAAIQGLNQKLEETRGELKRRDAENTELRARLEKLERSLEHKLNGDVK